MEILRSIRKKTYVAFGVDGLQTILLLIIIIIQPVVLQPFLFRLIGKVFERVRTRGTIRCRLITMHFIITSLCITQVRL